MSKKEKREFKRKNNLDIKELKQQLKDNSKDPEFVGKVRREYNKATQLKPKKAFTTMDV